MRAKKNINFLFCIHITFLFFILSAFYSSCLSPHCLSISSFFIHRAFSPSLFSQAQPSQTLFSITDLTSPATIDPSLHRRSHKPNHHRPFRFALHSFRFNREGPSHAVGGEIGWLVLVRARFIGEDREIVPLGTGLVSWYQNGQGIRHEFRFGCVDFSGFLFCSSSLVLIGTVGLWLCTDFYGFDGGCGGVLVVEWNIILL